MDADPGGGPNEFRDREVAAGKDADSGRRGFKFWGELSLDERRKIIAHIGRDVLHRPELHGYRPPQLQVPEDFASERSAYTDYGTSTDGWFDEDESRGHFTVNVEVAHSLTNHAGQVLNPSFANQFFFPQEDVVDEGNGANLQWRLGVAPTTINQYGPIPFPEAVPTILSHYTLNMQDFNFEGRSRTFQGEKGFDKCTIS